MSGPGWRRFPAEDGIAAWADHALAAAREVLADPVLAHWYRGECTWFAGVDCLPNDAEGRLEGGPPLTGRAIDALGAAKGALHPAQVSAVFPGYPKPMEGESAAAAQYRVRRDAAHVDGLLPVGPERRRMIREPHAYILGLPLTASPAEASPLVVWEGSHTLMRTAFGAALARHPVAAWPDVDLTEAYHAARRHAFETCRRVELPARPGEALLLDPMLLHGIAPWRAPEGPPRIVAYFRPQTDHAEWLAGEGAAHALFSGG